MDSSTHSLQKHGSRPSRSIFRPLQHYANQIWSSMSWSTYKMIFKGALAPTIGVAAMQAPSWALLWGNFGYLIVVSTMLTPSMLPQAKFLRLLVLNVTFTVAPAALTLFGFWLVIQARLHSRSFTADDEFEQEHGQTLAPYNAAASLTAAVWLAVQTLVAGALRDPADPLVDYAICCWMVVSNFGMVYVPLLPNMTAALGLMQKLLGSMLVGFCFSALTSFLIFPTTCRSSYLKSCRAIAMEVHDILQDLNAALKQQARHKTEVRARSHGKSSQAYNISDNIMNRTKALSSSQANMLSQLRNAKAEVCIGGPNGDKMLPISMALHSLSRNVKTLEHLLRVTEQRQDSCGAPIDRQSPMTCLEDEEFCPRQWINTCEALDASTDGLSHAADLLERGQRSFPSDEEQASLHSTRGLRARLEKESWRVSQERRYSKIGTKLDATMSIAIDLCDHTRVFLTVANALACTKARTWPWLVFPKWKSMIAVMTGHSNNTSKPLETWTNEKVAGKGSTRAAYLAKSQQFARRAWESTNSARAGFAARMTAATMFSAALAFFAPTQYWYNANHISWAQYAVALAIKQSSGQSTRGFLLRLIGTALAALSGMFVWYACVQQPAAVTVLYFLLLHLPLYVQVNSHNNATLGSVWAFATTTIVGYGVQTQALGHAFEKANNAIVQPVYLIAAIRMASIAAGLLLAWIFTLIPYPLTEEDLLQRAVQQDRDLVASYRGALGRYGRQDLFSDKAECASQTLEAEVIARHASHQAAIQRSLLAVKYDLARSKKFNRKQWEEMEEELDCALHDAHAKRLLSPEVRE